VLVLILLFAVSNPASTSPIEPELVEIFPALVDIPLALVEILDVLVEIAVACAPEIVVGLPLKPSIRCFRYKY
jgi:hypothetical protein